MFFLCLNFINVYFFGFFEVLFDINEIWKIYKELINLIKCFLKFLDN